tara:strand:+ start:317 stop:475 length:159 start_codon:yes stop_codon:yes gene_type:complete
LDSIGEGMNPRWLENKILEMAQDIKDLKEIMKAVSSSPPPAKETKYPINKGK